MVRADMPGRINQLLLWCLSLILSVALVRADDPPPATAAPKKMTRVVVIPVRDEIDRPLLYILRRGLKEAEGNADVVVLDMKTPGGALDVTFDIMEALAKFHGKTLTYVNSEAMSAGAFISATTEEIWFAPDGVIGAAAPVMSGGKDVETTMKLKIVSYLKARVRAISEGKGYRGQVISAMIDADYELKIGRKVIKPKGELLSLTATEASEKYGQPPTPLLAAGIAKTLDELLTKKFGEGGFTVTRLEVTWSEQLAVWLNAISPVLLGLGLLALFIEFKTPGFGIFGISGIVLLAIVFLSNYVAGFSGHEPILLFILGLVLVGVEIIFFPGIAVLAVSGVVLMFGALVWSMADLWPNEPITVAWSGDVFVRPLINCGLGVAMALTLGLLLARFIPKGWFFQKLAVAGGASGAAQLAGVAPEAEVAAASLVGARGVVVTGLFPSGQIEIEGRRYEARVEVGSALPGTIVVVKRASDFSLVVEPTNS
jgi:membrane-bound serine protease (ClpP class)